MPTARCIPLVSVVLTLFAAALTPAWAQMPQYQSSAAPFAFLMEAHTGTVLVARNPDGTMAPSSMGKMMTVYQAFQMIRDGVVKLDTPVQVMPETWKAWNNRGSTMFLAVGEVVTVEELLHGIVTLSGNDACVVLAEGLAGSEAAYVAMMNETAQRIGLTGSRFANTTGWPDDGEYVTPRDLATLARRTIVDFPELYAQFYPRPSMTRTLPGENKSITQSNRNPILGSVPGADGLKTGHTEAAGYGFTGSAQNNGMRLIGVVNGLTSQAERQKESVALMNWGFSLFENRKLFAAGDVLGNAPVWYGAVESVPLVLGQDILFTVPKSARRAVQANLIFTGPLQTPIVAGMQVAELVIQSPGGQAQRYPVKAGASVAAAGFIDRIVKGWQQLLFGGTTIEANEAAR